jgi:DNA-binding NtrC family response regulator
MRCCEGTRGRRSVYLAHLFLIDVGEPLRSQLGAWARAQRVRVLELPHPSALASETVDEVLLCVVALRRDADAAPDRIRVLRKALGAAPLVVLACGIGIDRAVALIRSGVTDVIDARGSADDVVARATRNASRGVAAELVGTSGPMRRLREEIATVAALSSPILVKGEPGSGKSEVARCIHAASRRRRGPFVHIDCNASPSAIVESAVGDDRASDRDAFRAAHGGTLYLEEVAALDAREQAHLLAFLEALERAELTELRASGASARLVAGTARDLREEVKRGRFRADLYFRIDVLPVSVPPLRDRIADIRELVRFGLDRLGRRVGVTPPELSAGLYRALEGHRWPGNVGELMGLLERAVVRHAGGAFDERHVLESLERVPRAPGRPPADDGATMSRAAVAGALVATGGNVARAARRLGVPRTTLRYRIGVLGLHSLLPSD